MYKYLIIEVFKVQVQFHFYTSILLYSFCSGFLNNKCKIVQVNVYPVYLTKSKLTVSRLAENKTFSSEAFLIDYLAVGLDN